LPRGCASGDALGRGTIWDGFAPSPDPDLHTVGDTSDGICNPPGERCDEQQGDAAGNIYGAEVVTVGDGVSNAPGLHLTVELPVLEEAWNPAERTGGPEMCDPDGVKNQIDAGIARAYTTLRLTTGSARAEFLDLDGDTCSHKPDTAASTPTVAGEPAPGPCCVPGQRLTLAGASVAYTGFDSFRDVLSTIEMPAEVVECLPAQ